MKRQIFILFAVLGFYSSVFILNAHAASVQLPQTGLTKCYNTLGSEISCAGTGQDGEKQSGVAWPNPRFTVSGDCVTDNLTGLMWSRSGNFAGQHTWQGALDRIDSLNNSGGLCGFTDWRLPNRKELSSLLNRQQINSASWLVSQGFSLVETTYWSSSTHGFGSDFAWSVLMTSAFVDGFNKIVFFWVWPVRSVQ